MTSPPLADTVKFLWSIGGTWDVIYFLKAMTKSFYILIFPKCDFPVYLTHLLSIGSLSFVRFSFFLLFYSSLSILSLVSVLIFCVHNMHIAHCANVFPFSPSSPLSPHLPLYRKLVLGWIWNIKSLNQLGIFFLSSPCITFSKNVQKVDPCFKGSLKVLLRTWTQFLDFVTKVSRTFWEKKLKSSISAFCRNPVSSLSTIRNICSIFIGE